MSIFGTILYIERNRQKEHPYVCANFDWWPNEKCDYGNCSWVGNGINKLDFDNKVLQQAATALSKNKHGLLRIGGSLQDHIRFALLVHGE